LGIEQEYFLQIIWRKSKWVFEVSFYGLAKCGEGIYGATGMCIYTHFIWTLFCGLYVHPNGYFPDESGFIDTYYLLDEENVLISLAKSSLSFAQSFCRVIRQSR
jgi:hypothetical protein